jgi:folate-binding protein YgfZ
MFGYHGAMQALTSPLEALAAARERVVAVDRPDLATVALTGADVLRYLHAVCTQHTADLRPGDANQALLLSPKGKIELAFRLAVLDGGVLLDADAEAAQALAARLARFVFRYDVAVAQPAAGAATLLGPGADAALTAAGLPAPAAGRVAIVGPELVVHRTPVGVDLVGPGATAAAARLEQAGVGRAAAELWELVRVEQGLPRAGRELTDDVLAEEAGLLGSHVHLDKGCYPGQETVARVHNLGQVQRRLAGLRFQPASGRDPDTQPASRRDPDARPIDGRDPDTQPASRRDLDAKPGGGEGWDDLPAPRTDLVTEDGRRAGQLRSVIRHPELGPIGLAYVRRVVEPGRLVIADGRLATVVELPFA